MKLDEYLRENYSASSTGSYLNTIGHYLAYMGDRAEKATHGEVMEYIGHLRSRNLHPKSVRNHLHGIKIYHSYLQAAGKREDHPCKHLRLKDRVDKQIHTESLYSREELREYYDGFPEGKEKIIAGLLVFQALTVQEISG
ncbi:phage integrase N-terminal SAM-like domain-containing protein, partial [Bacteroidales bacterium OttesenSCG-928-B11]|nr:phage integrase N-terminal SAM-like domain-containing protein [Bacteroidales bacterium OttesenSCG-928-B11]